MHALETDQGDSTQEPEDFFSGLREQVRQLEDTKDFLSENRLDIASKNKHPRNVKY